MTLIDYGLLLEALEAAIVRVERAFGCDTDEEFAELAARLKKAVESLRTAEYRPGPGSGVQKERNRLIDLAERVLRRARE